MTEGLTEQGVSSRSKAARDATMVEIAVVSGLALGLLGLSLALRAFDVGAMVNVDMYHLWSRRITHFVTAISTGDLAATYQSHHPGVTLLWLAGAVWSKEGVAAGPLTPEKLELAVLPVMIIGALFPVAAFLLTWRALGRDQRNVAWLTGALLATEPMLVAHSRNAHLDMLVTVFAWCSVLAVCIARRKDDVRWSIAAGSLMGLALLTKLSAAGLALGIVVVYLYRRRDQEHDGFGLWRHLGAFGVAIGVVVLAAWPALWVAPVETLFKLYRGAKVEVDKSSEFMLFGQTGRLRLHKWVYGVFLVYLVTPEFWASGILMLGRIKQLEPNLRAFARDITLAALPLIVLLIGSARVGNRYLIPILPMFAALSAIGLVTAWKWLEPHLGCRWLLPIGAVLVVALVGVRTLRVVQLHPLPITYCSSWTGVDCSRAFHLGWGEGLKEAAAIVADVARTRRYDAPPIVYGSGYAPLMRLWTPLGSAKSIDDAQLLVDYLPDRQRRIESWRNIERSVVSRGLEPLGEVVIQGRAYVRIFAGPMY
jgi:hypothetical protein